MAQQPGSSEARTLCAAPPRRSPRLDAMEAYRPPAVDPRIDLRLDANEGPEPDDRLMDLLASIPREALRRYPRARDLEARLASRWGVAPERVVVTNGGDDAIDRTCRSVLDPGATLVTHQPTFEMIPRGARLCGAHVRAIPWLDGQAPIAGMIDAMDDRTRLVALVSPNNPTGSIASLEQIRTLAAACERWRAPLLLDLAYVEFADPEAYPDPTGDLLALPNVVVIRTFSKAMGLAGLRVGCAIAPPDVADWLRIAGGPFPVSGISLALASAALDRPITDRDPYVKRVRDERARLSLRLRSMGFRVPTSHANFVSALVPDGERVRLALRDFGVGVRRLRVPLSEDSDAVADLVRVTLPGDEPAFQRLLSAVDSCKELPA